MQKWSWQSSFTMACLPTFFYLYIMCLLITLISCLASTLKPYVFYPLWNYAFKLEKDQNSPLLSKRVSRLIQSAWKLITKNCFNLKIREWFILKIYRNTIDNSLVSFFAYSSLPWEPHSLKHNFIKIISSIVLSYRSFNTDTDTHSTFLF